MSKYIDADLLHKEIESRLNESVELKGMAKRVCPAAYTIHEAAEVAYRGLLLFVDHQRQEQPEVDITEEIDKNVMRLRTVPTYDELVRFARYFFELGQRKAAEMYDEIEYNRQRAQEQEGQR